MSHGIVKERFNECAEEYDRQRRALIPHLDDIYTTVAELAVSDVPGPKILDLGAGTGLLTKQLFKRYQRAEFTLLDLSDKMLEVAKQRFDGLPNFHYINGNYLEHDFEDSFDIVTSSLSIHHLKHAEKKFLYDKIYSILNDDGVFINADQVLAPNPENERVYHAKWMEYIESGPLTESDKKTIFKRMELDKPATLEDNLKWLKDSRFKDVDVYYKYYTFTVIYGKKKV